MLYNVKRCPFCHGHNLTMDMTEFTSQVRCFDCGASGPNARGDSQAVALWNDGMNENALVNPHTTWLPQRRDARAHIRPVEF